MMHNIKKEDKTAFKSRLGKRERLKKAILMFLISILNFDLKKTID